MTAMRSVCSATLSFGLVSIPVKAYLTASAEKVSFNWLTPSGHRTKQKLLDGETGEEIERSQVVNGYEVGKDSYVTFTNDELDALSGDKKDVIEICEVCDNDITPLQVERCLYLAPDHSSDKSYRLLHKALSKTKKMAICKWYVRGKDHLVAVVPVGQLLCMYQLYYASELRSFEPNFAHGSEPSDKEVALAIELLGSLSSDKLDLARYYDEYVSRVAAAVEEKRAGKTLTAAAPKKAKVGAPLDLVALLESSVKASPKKTAKKK